MPPDVNPVQMAVCLKTVLFLLLMLIRRKKGATPIKNPRKIPELLAPGGDVKAVKAALLAGADAVYLGLDRFNARKRAKNISLDDLKDLVKLAAEKSARLYITLNVLVTETELVQVIELVRDSLNAGANAFILQDYGLLSLLPRLFPGIEMHASTQMTTHNRGQLQALSQLGPAQVNLSRELTVNEISILSGKAFELNMITEVFVHGAYCISYSGQCYMSVFLSGLSGNRGACIQACRRKFSSDGKEGTFFSMKDNNAFALAESLFDAGAGSFKIEGRIKNFHYVHQIVSSWREQLDRVASGKQILQDDKRLHSVFNRKFDAGFLKNRVGADMFTPSPLDQSLKVLARIENYHADRKLMTLDTHLEGKLPLEVKIYTRDNKFICTGSVEKKQGENKYSFKIEHVLKGRINLGDLLCGFSEGRVQENLEEVLDPWNPSDKLLDISISGSPGQPLELRVSITGASDVVIVKTEGILEKARGRALNHEMLLKQLGRLGGTGCKINTLNTDNLDDQLFLPVSELNQLRRRMVAELDPPVTSHPFEPITDGSRKRTATLAVLVNSEKEALFYEGKGFRVIREALVPEEIQEGKEYWLPPIIPESELENFNRCLLKNRPAHIISNQLSHSQVCDIPWTAGPFLNICNSEAALSMNTRFGAGGFFFSREISAAQIKNISLTDSLNSWYILAGPLLMMNTRQCLIKSSGHCSKELVDHECFESCRRHLSLTDEKGKKVHVVKRPGAWNEIYHHSWFYTPEAVNELAGHVSVFLLDLRILPTMEVQAESLHDFALKTRTYLKNGNGRAPLAPFRDISKAQYNNDLI